MATISSYYKVFFLMLQTLSEVRSLIFPPLFIQKYAQEVSLP